MKKYLIISHKQCFSCWNERLVRRAVLTRDKNMFREIRLSLSWVGSIQVHVLSDMSRIQLRDKSGKHLLNVDLGEKVDWKMYLGDVVVIDGWDFIIPFDTAAAHTKNS